MFNIKKIISFAIVISFFSALFLWIPSFAEDYGLKKTADVAKLKSEIADQDQVFGVTGKIISAVLSLVGIVFFALTLFAGIMWMTARGDSARVDKAKNILETAAVGLMIVIGAYAIVKFVFDEILK